MKVLKLRVLFAIAALTLFACPSSFAQFGLPQVVLDSAQYEIRGCEVLLNVNGRYHQLFVNGIFSGNFQAGLQDNQLAQTIDFDLQRRVCNYKSQYELQYVRDPNLIQEFVNFQFQNCYVRPYVDGQYNQAFIRNQFRGNYLVGTEDLKLRSALAGYIVDGVCLQGQQPQPPFPQPQPPFPQPQGCVCTLINQWGSFVARGPTCDVAVVEVVNACANSNPQAVCSAHQAQCH